jgi:hypothetical protein
VASPDEALQKAVFSALTSNEAVLAALAGADPAKRVYDRVPAKYVLPYITIGEIQVLDDTHCEAAWEAFVTTHAWSDKVGKGEVQRIGGAIGEALNAALVIPGFVCTEFQFRERRYFTEPDGLTTHGVIVHRYLIDQAVGV